MSVRVACWSGTGAGVELQVDLGRRNSLQGKGGVINGGSDDVTNWPGLAKSEESVCA